MLSINWSDVWKMVESIKVPLIVIGVALALAIIVSLAVFKMGKPASKLTRSTAWVAALVAVVVAVVSMMYGGFKTVLDLAAGTGALTDASKAQVEDLGNDISVGLGLDKPDLRRHRLRLAVEGQPDDDPPRWPPQCWLHHER